MQKDVFDPNFGLFQLSLNKSSIYPNPLSCIVPDFEYHFRMLGRLIAKSLIDDSVLMQASFTRSFMKHLVGKPIMIKDLQDIDPDLARNLEWILSKNPIKSLK